MDSLAKHEVFEIEILNQLNSAKILEKMVFGGGTMLRLCHELNRYSADLDFWLVLPVDAELFLNKIIALLNSQYEVTDSKIKHYSILVEVRSEQYPKRLKLEIRKEIRKWDMEIKIAYSKNSNRQVFLKTHTLDQSMANKIEALVDRGEIRDAFDMEFLLRKGTEIPALSDKIRIKLENRIESFRDNDYKVKLGSLLEEEARQYYVKNHFEFLLSKLK